MIKRVVDMMIAGSVLGCALPVIASAAIAIKIDTPGPVLFKQLRVGRARRNFRTIKLRTMNSSSVGPQITAAADSRITRVGRALRRMKLDELPQLWNVLRGDMSIVGPRPEVPAFVEHYRPEWNRLFSVRPGITDLASIVFRDEEKLLAEARDRDRAYREVIMPLKLSLALEGVDHSSFLYDLKVIAQTVASIAFFKSRRTNQILDEASRRIAELNRESYS